MRRLFLLAFIWGWSFLFIKVAVEGASPPTVAALRVGLGATMLVGLLVGRGQRLPRSGVFWRDVTVAALFGNAVPFTMLAWGEERITSALTAVLNASTPIFTAAFAFIVLRDRLRLPQVVGLFLGLAGVAVAAGLGGADVASSSLVGAAAAVGAAVNYGVAFVYMRRHLTGVAPLVASAAQLSVATALLLPFAVVTSLDAGLDLPPHRLASILLLGLVGTGIAYVLNYRVIGELGATRASLVTYLVPIVAVAVGTVALGEPFSLRLILGGLMIVSAVALIHERLPGLEPVRAAAPDPA